MWCGGSTNGFRWPNYRQEMSPPTMETDLQLQNARALCICPTLLGCLLPKLVKGIERTVPQALKHQLCEACATNVHATETCKKKLIRAVINARSPLTQLTSSLNLMSAGSFVATQHGELPSLFAVFLKHKTSKWRSPVVVPNPQTQQSPHHCQRRAEPAPAGRSEDLHPQRAELQSWSCRGSTCDRLYPRCW